MADILRGYGAARESAYFKVEQEVDVQRHRKRLLKEGKLPPAPPPHSSASSSSPHGHQQGRGGSRMTSLEASIRSVEVLPEVLQQQARLDDPDAAARREYRTRGKGAPPPLTPEELARYRAASAAGGGRAIGHVPRMTFGRNRYNLDGAMAAPAHGGGLVEVAMPHAQEVAGRAYAASVRATAYGSVLAAVAVGLGVGWVLTSSGATDASDLRRRAREAAQPLGEALHVRLAPVGATVRSWLGGRSSSPTAGAHNASTGSVDAEGGDASLLPVMSAPAAAPPRKRSEFAQRLARRFNPKMMAAEEEATAAAAAAAAAAGLAGTKGSGLPATELSG